MTPLARALCFFVTLALFVPLEKAHAHDEWELSNQDRGLYYSMSAVWNGHQLSLTAPMLERVADVLGLDEQQRDEMMDMYAGLEIQHLEAWVEYSESSDDQDNAYTGWDHNWEDDSDEETKMLEAYRDRSEALVEMFFEDLRLFITPEQEQRWPLLEMERRRQNTLTSYGACEEEGFDIIAIVRALDLDEDDAKALAPVLSRYAKEMDEALQARNRQLHNFDIAHKSFEEDRQGLYDIDWELPNSEALYEEAQKKALDLTDDLIRAALVTRPACERVGEINTLFRAEIEGLLGSSDRIAFQGAFEKSPEEEGGYGWDPTSYSRARELMRFLLNMEDRIVAWDAASSVEQTNRYYTSWRSGHDDQLRMARETEPLSATQATKIERMIEEIEEELDDLSALTPEFYANMYNSQQESFTIRSFEGSVTLTKKAKEDDEANPYAYYWDPSSISDEDKAAMDRWGRKKAEIEQRYVDRMRSILTLKQRALLATQ